ncbi:hypothetical protein QFC20_005839 [Naganishia adeliensis]|uniref:Uncharacterized protein n=1 Tax=Naganishia adeliensis TaxID=92952 RepID=A0ACC2VIW1_9TREE|nr:hypothetical protein QFC20_005839 [Naganishia adeliensis]
MQPKEKLNGLREMMMHKRLDAYIIPSEDDHNSEYIADCDARRAYISGFTGSAGRAAVTADEALLWTDGRYFLQAEKQLDPSCWKLMKAGEPDVPPLSTWLMDKFGFADASRIGIDPKVVTFEMAKTLKEQLQEKEGGKESKRELVAVQENLVDEIWKGDKTEDGKGGKPARPAGEVFVLEEKYTGRGIADKLDQLRKALRKANSAGIVVSMLDEVAWLFNLRGSDIIYNPVFFSYAIVTPTDCTIYVREESTNEQVKLYLKENDITVKPYDSIWNDLSALGKTVEESLEGDTKPKETEEKVEDILRKIDNCNGKIMVGSHTSWAVALALGESNIVIRPSPIEDAKALKNSVELEGMRQCHIRDGAALARYFAWLEEQLENGAKLTEFEAAVKLEEYRAENKLSKGLSFDTISSTGPNGAIIHYKPTEEDCAVIDKDQMYLCDSGGQYLDGTTDVTRTYHFGTPSEHEIRAFTRVLQGVIAIDTCIFPKDTKGGAIDALARLALWEDGLDFRHSVGHGVGSFLNVHEGPVYIGSPSSRTEVGMREGLVISNEPGYYEDGAFGIRTENLVMVVKADTRHSFGGKPYLKFENLTMCPVQVSLIDASLLTPKEKKWLNSYHEEVLQKVGPLLEQFGDARAVEWLKRMCQSVPQ